MAQLWQTIRRCRRCLRKRKESAKAAGWLQGNQQFLYVVPVAERDGDARPLDKVGTARCEHLGLNFVCFWIYSVLLLIWDGALRFARLRFASVFSCKYQRPETCNVTPTSGRDRLSVNIHPHTCWCPNIQLKHLPVLV